MEIAVDLRSSSERVLDSGVGLWDIFEQLCTTLNPEEVIPLYWSCKTLRSTISKYVRLINHTHSHNKLVPTSFWGAVFLYRCETSYLPSYRNQEMRNTLAIIRDESDKYDGVTNGAYHRARDQIQEIMGYHQFRLRVACGCALR